MPALPVYLYPLDSSAWIVPLTYSFPILSIVVTSSFCQCHVSKSYITACLTVLWTLIFIIAAVLLSQITLDTCAATPSCLYCNFTSLLEFLALYGSLHVLKLIYYHCPYTLHFYCHIYLQLLHAHVFFSSEYNYTSLGFLPSTWPLLSLQITMSSHSCLFSHCLHCMPNSNAGNCRQYWLNLDAGNPFLMSFAIKYLDFRQG